jgi:hypothetical protein
MRQADIRMAMGQAIAQRRFPDLINSLRAVEGVVLFRGLFPLAVAAQRDGLAYPAAYLLLELEPPCDLSCEDALRLVAPNWDISIQEVPLYLITQFGKRELRRAVEFLVRDEAIGEVEKKRLETILYWIDFPASETIGWFIRTRDGFLRSLGEATG